MLPTRCIAFSMHAALIAVLAAQMTLCPKRSKQSTYASHTEQPFLALHR